MSNLTLKTGIYLIETLTSGMYNNPLTIFREYIQNAVDSIDRCKIQNDKYVQINLYPQKRSIEVYDNGPGISRFESLEILNKIGISNKCNSTFRGFRGIGRLGGIAFCDNIIFRTKSSNEEVETIQKWDCKKLRNIIANSDNNIFLEDIYSDVIKNEFTKVKNFNDSYFSVYLDNVKSYRNIIFDIQKIEQYLRLTAPIPFDESFFFHSMIDDYLKTNVMNYNTYNIYLNNRIIKKSYSNSVKVTKGHNDKIHNIEFFSLSAESETLAVGWIGERDKLLGSIKKGDITSGIHVKSGNILIGDSHLLDSCFKESRFNSYFIGEVHIISRKLIPNSRRDNFVDNYYKEVFFEEFEKHLGLPLSKKIRSISNQNKKIIEKKSKLRDSFLSIVKEKIISDKKITKKKIIDILFDSCTKCNSFKYFLEHLGISE